MGTIFKRQAFQELTLNKGSQGCPETSVTTKLRCVTSQNSEGLIYAVAEAWNYM